MLTEHGGGDSVDVRRLYEEDWRDRARWDRYTEAVEDMFAKTDHDHARWDVIAGEQKKWARVAVLETLNRRIVEGIERYERESA